MWDKLAECTASTIDQFFTWKPTFFFPTFPPPPPHAMLFVRKGLPTSRPTLHRGGRGSERILQQFEKKALCPTHFGQDCRFMIPHSFLFIFSGRLSLEYTPLKCLIPNFLTQSKRSVLLSALLMNLIEGLLGVECHWMDCFFPRSSPSPFFFRGRFFFFDFLIPIPTGASHVPMNGGGWYGNTNPPFGLGVERGFFGGLGCGTYTFLADL